MDIVQGMLDLLNVRTFLLTALIFIPFERLFSLRDAQKTFRKHLLNDLVYLFFNGLLVRICVAIIVTLLMAGISALVPAAVAMAVQGQPLPLQVIEIIVLADTGQYLAHRAFHAVPFLWKFHAIHHSIEELDWIAAYRVHPLDHVLTQCASLLPVFVLGYSNAAIAIFFLIFQWHALVVHANTRLGVGPLGWLVASPQFHHWHHANEPHAYNRNFAAQLPLIDLLGGTYHMPGKQFPKIYGIDRHVSQRYLEQLIGPFRRTRRPIPAADAADAPVSALVEDKP